MILSYVDAFESQTNVENNAAPTDNENRLFIKKAEMTYSLKSKNRN